METAKQAALSKRRAKSKIVSGLMVKCFAEYDSEYGRKHMGAIAEQLLVAWLLWREDDDRTLKIVDISRALRMPRSNVRRDLEKLCGAGLARKIGREFAPDPAFIITRVEAPYFRNICDAILHAADDLRRVDGH